MTMSDIRFTEFCDKAIKVNEAGEPFTLCPHQRTVFDLADDLREEWTTFAYSTIKKSGKTTLQGLYALKWGLEHPDDELILQANDYAQSLGRAFDAVSKLVERNKIGAKILADTITFPNGTVIKAIASDYGGEAGANHGFHGIDEPWAVTTESGIRLIEELTPLLNKPSIRFVSTYSGWLNQSKWLWDFYLEAVSPDVYPDAKAERIHDELPIFLNREARIFSYWDTGVQARRMPWQIGLKAEAYYRQQQRSMRAGAFSRLHLNEWGAGDDKFLSDEMWRAITDESLSPIVSGATLFGGWDASTKRDSTAVVFVCWDGDKIRLACHKIFKPSADQPIDFEAVEAYVREVCANNTVLKIYADPHQLFSTIQKLQKENFAVEEYQQTLGNLTTMATALFDAIKNRTLKTYPAAELKEHALNALAVEGPRGYVIKKERAAGKIDGFIALGMALTAAIQHGQTGQVVRGFNLQKHVSQTPLMPQPGPVLIGVSFDPPATVIVQPQGQTLAVFAAFAAESGLKRLLEGTVRPWLSAHLPRILQDSRSILGLYEDTSEFELIRVVQEILDGNWDISPHGWPSRKENMLGLIDRGVPFLFQPALQLDPVHARTLTEALGGRWDQNEDKKTIWYGVANALSLVACRFMAPPTPAREPAKIVSGAWDVRRDGIGNWR